MSDGTRWQRARADKRSTVKAATLTSSRQVKHRKSKKPARNSSPAQAERRRDAQTAGKGAKATESAQTDALDSVSSGPSQAKSLQQVTDSHSLSATNGKEATNRFQAGNPYQWRPGQSGNPSGLPSEAREVSTAVIRDRLARVDAKLDKSQLEIIVDGMIRRAKQGSYKDKKLVLAYGLGMPKQVMELDARLDFTDRLTRIRERQRQLPTPAASGEPTNGHSDAETVQAAEIISEAPVVPAAERETRIKRVSY